LFHSKGVKVVTEAAKAAGVKRVVLISSLLVTDQHKCVIRRLALRGAWE